MRHGYSVDTHLTLSTPFDLEGAVQIQFQHLGDHHEAGIDLHFEPVDHQDEAAVDHQDVTVSSMSKVPSKPNSSTWTITTKALSAPPRRHCHVDLLQKLQGRRPGLSPSNPFATH